MNKKMILTLIILLILIPAAFAFNPINWIKSLFGRAPPEIERAWADPVKVLPEQIMTTNIIVKDRYGIAEITAEIPHENGFDTVKLHLIEGDERYGTWQNAWKEHNAKNEKWYTTKIIVTNKKGINSYAFVDWQDPTPSHPASEVTAGTFDTGNFSFPNNVSIQGTLSGGSPLKIAGGLNITSGNFSFGSSSDTLYVDDANSRVGIGTTTPGQKLNVVGDINSTGKVSGNFTGSFGSIYSYDDVQTGSLTLSTSYVHLSGLNITVSPPSGETWVLLVTAQVLLREGAGVASPRDLYSYISKDGTTVGEMGTVITVDTWEGSTVPMIYRGTISSPTWFGIQAKMSASGGTYSANNGRMIILAYRVA